MDNALSDPRQDEEEKKNEENLGSDDRSHA